MLSPEQSPEESDDELLFLSEDEPAEAAATAEPWIVLIVDDDKDVHAVTRVVLNTISFQGRPLELHSCYSGAEACAFLASRQDVAVMFLDVVMENDHSGLDVARHTREVLGNRKTRIILRTGQPGQAPEENVILNYDINDYKSKTELTAQKLFTTLITALRSYADLVALEASRDGLRHIGDASTDLMRIRHPREFIERTMAELLAFVDGTRGAIFGRDSNTVGRRHELRPLVMKNWPVAEEAALLARVKEIATDRTNVFGDERTFLFFATPDQRTLIVYLDHPGTITGLRRELLELFITRVGVGYDNVSMQEWLEHTNQWLERQVQDRTRQLSERTQRLEVAYRQMAEELKLAHILQQAILPAEFPAGDIVSVSATMVPAHEVGGDFYHLLPLEGNRLAFLIADVSGKGVPAAFFMLRAHALFNEIAASGASPAECLSRANARLCDSNPLMLFITLFFGVLDMNTLSLTYASAGHDMPLLVRGDGSLAALPRSGGMLLGTFDDARFAEASVALHPGDRLFLFTDGFTEAMDASGGLYGQGRLEATLLRERHRPLTELMNAAIADVQAFAGEHPQSDDITCLVVGIGRENA